MFPHLTWNQMREPTITMWFIHVTHNQRGDQPLQCGSPTWPTTKQENQPSQCGYPNWPISKRGMIHLVGSSGWFIWLVQLVGSLDLFHLLIGFLWISVLGVIVFGWIQIIWTELDWFLLIWIDFDWFGLIWVAFGYRSIWLFSDDFEWCRLVSVDASWV